MDHLQDQATGAALSEADIKRSTLYLALSAQQLEGVVAEGGVAPVIHSHLLVEGDEAIRDLLRSRRLALPFAETILFVDEDQHYTLVPRDFIRGGVTPRHWMPELPEGHCLQSTTVSDLGIDIVFSTTEETYDSCQTALREPVYSHPVAPLSLAGAIYSRRHHPRVLMAQIGREHTDLCYCESGRILLANRFAVTDPVDLLYYITTVWQHFHLDREQDHLLLFAGEAGREMSGAAELLSDAIAQVRLDDYTPLTDRPELLSEIQSPTLRLALICGS